MVTRKKTAIEYTQREIRRELKCFIFKHQLNEKEDSYAGNMGQKAVRHIKNKQQNDRGKSFLISNYFKCKWIKLSIQNRSAR